MMFYPVPACFALIGKYVKIRNNELTYVIVRNIITVRRGEPMRYSEIEKALKKEGCYIVRQGANHALWYSPKTGKTFPVSRHRTEEIPAGTLRSIQRDAGLV